MEAQRQAEAVEEAKRKKEPFAYARIDQTKSRLYRVFNSADMDLGGRFYGAWWQTVPRRYRQHLTINGKATCEYDYSAIHMRLAYAEVGVPVPHEQDPYSKPYGEGFKPAVKAAFNILLNSDKAPKQQLVPEFSSRQMGMSWLDFLEGIRKHHHAVRHLFETGVGTRFQRIDADVAEAVMLEFVRMRQPCLPIHDSFVTYAHLASDLMEATSKAAWQVAGVELPVKLEHLSTVEGCNGLVTKGIETILTELHEDEVHPGWHAGASNRH